MLVKNNTHFSAIVKTYADIVGLSVPSIKKDSVFCLNKMKAIEGDPTVSAMGLKEGDGIEVWKKKDLKK
jgi:hypothetical protein